MNIHIRVVVLVALRDGKFNNGSFQPSTPTPRNPVDVRLGVKHRTNLENGGKVYEKLGFRIVGKLVAILKHFQKNNA